MTPKTTSLMMVGFIFVILGSYNEGNTIEKTKEKIDRWVLFTEDINGKGYFDRVSIKYINRQTVKVWIMDKYKKKGKDEYIQIRKESKYPIAGYDKLDHTLSLWELIVTNQPWILFPLVTMTKI